MKSHQITKRRRSIRRGFSLMEASISALLVGTWCVAAGRAVNSSVRGQSMMADRAKAAWLADALAMEIHQQSYMEPGATTSPITRESGESSGSRATWDDVDDYHGWSDSPPQNKDGTTIANLTGWQRSVTVTWVTLANIATTSGTETGVKKITITVSFNGKTLASRVLIRTKGS
jgi:Tfp pilus assembly protein PilV